MGTKKQTKNPLRKISFADSQGGRHQRVRERATFTLFFSMDLSGKTAGLQSLVGV